MPLIPILYYPFNEYQIKNYATGIPVNDTNLQNPDGDCHYTTDNERWGTGSLVHTNSSVISYLQINKTITNTNGYSFSFWVNFIDQATNSMVFDFTVINNDTSKRIFMWYNSDKELYVGTGNNWNISANQFLNPVVNTWYHIVWTLAPDSTSKIYLDGNLVKTFTSIPYINDAFHNNYLFHAPNGSGYPGINGYIDDFRYYDGIFTPDQVSNLYNFNSLTSLIEVACLLEGTKVWTRNGYVPIETLKEGDSIRTKKFDIAITKVGKWSVDLSNPSDSENLSNKMYKIPAGRHGATSDVYISHYHRFMFEGEPSDDNFKRLMGIPEQVGLQPAPVTEYAKDGKYNIYHLQIALGNHYIVNGGCLVESWEKGAEFF